MNRSGHTQWTLLMIMLCHATQAAPLEAYARLPLYEDVAISPDGNQLAMVTTVGEKREAIIQSLRDPDQGARIQVGDRKLRSLRWASPEHLLINVSESTDFLFGSQYEMYQQRIYDLKRSKLFNQWSFPLTHNAALITIPGASLPEGQAIIFSGGVLNHQSGIFRFDLDRQNATLLDSATERNRWYSWLTDKGALLAMSTYDEVDKEWSFYLLRKSKWLKVQSQITALDRPEIIGFGPETDVVTLNRLEDGAWVPRRLSLVDGKWGEALPTAWRGTGYILDRMSRRLIGTVQTGFKSQYVFFDTELQKKWDRVVQPYSSEEIELVSRADDWSKVVLRVFGERTGAGYVLVDTTTGERSYLGNYYAAIDAQDINPVKAVSYAAADGLMIGGYLTLPRRVLSGKAPLVVLPHGGPVSRDFSQFDWLAQALATAGYWVLQPNFRGSRGIDDGILKAGYGEWGGKMQTDLSDGVRVLVKRGLVDPRRVCIVGQGYGGYAALAGAAWESDVYRCAISVSGISNLNVYLTSRTERFELRDNFLQRNLLRYFGATGPRDAVIKQRSPALHADQVNIPILLVHGDNDSVVPFKQSQLMAQALQKAGKPYELVRLKSEDHWLSKPDTRLQMLRAVVKFLETHNPP